MFSRYTAYVIFWLKRFIVDRPRIYSPHSTWLVTSHLDTTQHVRPIEPMHLSVSSLSNSTAQHTRHDSLDSRDTLDALDTMSATGATRHLVCCVICVKLWHVSYSLIYWIIHLFHSTEEIGFVYVRAQNDYACTGEHYSLFVVRHVGTSTARRARHDRLDALDTFETGRDEPRVSFGLMKWRHTNVTSALDAGRLS